MLARLRLALASALLLPVLLTAGHATAQLPTDPSDDAVGFALVVPRAHIETDFLVPAQFRIIIKDTTRDSGTSSDLPGGGAPVTPISHQVMLAVNASSPPLAESGWHLIMETFKPTYGGQDAEAIVQLTPTTQVNAQEITVVIEGTYTGPNNHVETQNTSITARVRPYTNMAVRIGNPVQRAGQFEIVKYEVQVTNNGVYPEQFKVFADSDKPDVRVLPPLSMWVLPGQTRSENISLLTPHGKPYEIGRSVVINIMVQSERGALVPQVASLQIRGPYIPTYWLPLLLVGLLAGSITLAKTRERAEIRRLERGRPRRVALSPRQMVLLQEQKRLDPEAYKEHRSKLDQLYKARRERYVGARKAQLARDRAEHALALAEYKAETKRRKAEAKVQKRDAAAARKAEAKRVKAERKDIKAKEKELRKKQKLVAKARKKQAKLDEKQAARDAKAAAAAAKAQARAERAAAKDAKRAAKLERRQEKP